MPTYSLLVQPSFNRVYAKAAAAIGAAELTTIGELARPSRFAEITQVRRGGVDYLDVHSEEALAAADLHLLAELSATFTLFEVRDDGALLPLEVARTTLFDDDLLTTLRYSGKTNDQFTKLLLNLALAASDGGIDALAAAGIPPGEEHRFRVFDPVCGRGTTINQAAMQGFDAVGIDAAKKDHELYVGFLKKYLQDHRVKHSSESFSVKKGPAAPAARTTFTITPPPGRSPVETGEKLNVDVIYGDTIHTREFLTRSSVDVIVGDLPYGVQHATRNDQWGSSRNPATMLGEALPAWRQVLRLGGAMALAWNTKILSRRDLETHVRDAGFDLADAGNDGRFAHQVDRTITRDVLLATKAS
jgi:hypothetical protein